MALIKSTENPETGAIAEYIRVRSLLVRQDFDSDKPQSKRFSVSLEFYKNKAAREAGKKAMFPGVVDLVSNMEIDTLDSRPQLYAAIRSLPEFASAQNDD